MKARTSFVTPTPEPYLPAQLPVPGETVHCLITGTTIPTGGGFAASGVVLERAQNVIVTAEMLEATRDRFGTLGGIALAHDPDEQQRRWGHQKFAPGPAPAEMQPWTPGSADWGVARRAALHDANREPDARRRLEALRRVQVTYGDAPPTSWSTEPVGESTAERKVREEWARRNATGQKYRIESFES